MPAKLDPTAPRKKYALLRFVRRWNKAQPKRRIERPEGFNPKTRKVGKPAREFVRRLQREVGLPVTGGFDRMTMAKILPPGVRGQVMAVVHSEVGTHEWPAGSNWGPVKRFLKAAGIAFAAPWCAAFVTWALRKAGYTGPLPTSPGWVDSWLALARKHGLLKPISQSRRGDLWVWHFGNDRTAHIGFCDEGIKEAGEPGLADDVAYYVDGNVGAHGGSVRDSSRAAGQISYCIDLVKLAKLGWRLP